MVALSLSSPPITTQKENNKNQEKAHDSFRAFYNVRNNFHNYLHSIMLCTQRWLGVLR
jgi:hypothetical protein